MHAQMHTPSYHMHNSPLLEFYTSALAGSANVCVHVCVCVRVFACS